MKSRLKFFVIFFIVFMTQLHVHASSSEYIIETNDIDSIITKYNLKMIDQIEEQSIYKISLSNLHSLQKLKKDPSILSITPNNILRGDKPNYFQILSLNTFNKSWGFSSMNFANFTFGDNPVKIAILDTGIDFPNKNLTAISTDGFNTFIEDELPQDENGHGTHVAGIIGLQTENIKLVPIKIMDENGYGEVFSFLKGMNYAIEEKVDVINISIGTKEDIPIVKEVIHEALNNGIIIVAATGNSGKSSIFYPAKYEGVIAVGSYSQVEERTAFSQYGQELDFVAPGVGIYSSALNDDYEYREGTSMSTAFLARAIGMMKTIDKDLTSANVFEYLKAASEPMTEDKWNEETGFGKINMQKAYELLNNKQIYLDHFKQWLNKNERVSPTKEWIIKFNTTMSPLSINQQNLYVTNSLLQKAKIELNRENESTLSLVPKDRYIENETYYLFISDRLTDLNGNKLKSSHFMRFKIKSGSIH